MLKLLSSMLVMGGMRALALCSAVLTSAVLGRALGPADFGVVAVIMSVLNLVSVPSNDACSPLLVREIGLLSTSGKISRVQAFAAWAKSLADRLAWPATACLAVLALLLLLTGAADTNRVAWAVLFGAPVIVLWSRMTWQAGILRGSGHPRVPQALGWVLQPVCHLLLMLVLWRFSWLTPASALASMVVSVLTCVLVGSVLVEEKLPKAPKGMHSIAAGEIAKWKTSWRVFLTLGLLSVAMLKLPVLLLGVLSTDLQAGLYRAAENVALFVSLPLLLLNLSVSALVAQLFRNQERTEMQALLQKCTRLALVVALPAGLLLSIFAEEVLVLIYGAEFSAAASVLIVLVVGQLINVACGPVAMVLSMAGHEQRAVPAMVGSLLGMVLLIVPLAEGFGATGAAVAVSAALASWNVLLLYTIRRNIGISPAVI